MAWPELRKGNQGLAPGNFGRGREMPILAGFILVQPKERLKERHLHVLWGSMRTGFPRGLAEKGYCGSTGSRAIVTCLVQSQAVFLGKSCPSSLFMDRTLKHSWG